MSGEEFGFIQLVCPDCGSYVIPLLNANTGGLKAVFECYNLACGWKGNYPVKVRISYSNRSNVEDEQGGK